MTGVATDEDMMPEEVHRLRDWRHERLGLREFQPKLALEEGGQRSFLLVRDPLGFRVLLRAEGSGDENDEVIRVSDGEEDREPAPPVGGAVPARSSGDLLGVGPRRRCATGPHLTLVALLDRAERDVRQQRRQDPALGSSGVRPEELLFGEDAGTEESCDQSRHLAVPDAPAEPVHERMVPDMIETSLDVSLDGPLIREPMLDPASVTHGSGAQQHPQMLQRSVDSAPGAEAVRDGEEVRLENRLQDALQRCLHDAIFDGGDAQGTVSPWSACLGDSHPPDRARAETAELEFFAQSLHEALDPTALAHELGHRDAVDARRAAPAITGDALEGASQGAGVHDEPPQLAEDVVQILPTSPVKLALDVPEPVPIGLRRRIHGFPQRHARFTHGLPPFALYAALPRSDYYGGSAPRTRRRQTWWLADEDSASARLGVPVFTTQTHGAVGGRLCPWQRGPLPRSRLGGGVPIAGTPRRFQLATGLWLQTRTRRGILPYRGFDHRL